MGPLVHLRALSGGWERGTGKEAWTIVGAHGRKWWLPLKQASEFPATLCHQLCLAPDRGSCYPREWGGWGFWAPGPSLSCLPVLVPSQVWWEFLLSIHPVSKPWNAGGALGSKRRQIKEERPFTVTSNCVFFRGLRLKPLFLEEWGEEEPVLFVAKQLKLHWPCCSGHLCSYWEAVTRWCSSAGRSLSVPNVSLCILFSEQSGSQAYQSLS